MSELTDAARAALDRWYSGQTDSPDEVVMYAENLRGRLLELETDPRKLGGSIAGPGGPYGQGDVVIDTTNAVILDACEVAIVGGVRDGVLDPKPICTLVLRGRVNKTTDRAQALFLMNEDGAAGIVTELIGLESRAGWGHEFIDRVRARLDQMPL